MTVWKTAGTWNSVLLLFEEEEYLTEIFLCLESVLQKSCQFSVNQNQKYLITVSQQLQFLCQGNQVTVWKTAGT